MVEAPNDARLLSDTEMGDSWVNASEGWRRVGSYCLLISIGILSITWLTPNIEGGSAVLAIIVIVLLSIGWNTAQITKARKELEVIAISPGHPWHDSDSLAGTTVFVLGGDSQWVGLEPETRLMVTKDPLLNRSQLRNGGPDGDVVVHWNGEADERIITLINMAQALANAQDRDEGEEDDIEAAREREETGESLLEREWMDTEEGSVDYEPGAILRAFKRSKDIKEDP